MVSVWFIQNWMTLRTMLGRSYWKSIYRKHICWNFSITISFYWNLNLWLAFLAQHIASIDGKRGLFTGLTPRLCSGVLGTVVHGKVLQVRRKSIHLPIDLDFLLGSSRAVSKIYVSFFLLKIIYMEYPFIILSREARGICIKWSNWFWFTQHSSSEPVVLSGN